LRIRARRVPARRAHRNEPLARGLDQVEHALEALRAAFIRIGDIANAELRREIEEQPQVTPVRARSQCVEREQVAAVHRENPVEALEVVGRDLPRAASAEIIATRASVLDRAHIRRLADLVVAGAGRVDQPAIC